MVLILQRILNNKHTPECVLTAKSQNLNHDCDSEV